MTLLLAHSRHLSYPRYYSSQHCSSISSSADLKFVCHRRVFRCCAVSVNNGGQFEGLRDRGLVVAASDTLKSSGASNQNHARSSDSEREASAAREGPAWISVTEGRIERAIFDFRFLTLMAIAGSLVGSLLCFLKGTGFICESFIAYFRMCLNGMHTGKVILRLVEAVDVYLVGTVMLIFGMGLYGLFISNEPIEGQDDRALKNTTLFGMFELKARPLWMRITTLDTLKTKLGHVIVMILLVKLFEKSKTVLIVSSMDLLYYSVSIFLSSVSLYVLHRLHAP
jgi:uncharacterized membrane protein YqhA